MTLVETLRALAPIDSRNILRDPLLGWLIVFALLFGAAVRWGIPPLTGYLKARYGFDLSPYHLLIISGCLLATPVIIGTIVGFLLLDQKDDRTLDALRVTPMSLTDYVAYRVIMPVLVCALVTIATVEIADFVGYPAHVVWLTGIASAPLAPLTALALACFAENKVQGFALSKASSVITMPPVFAFFVHSNWQFLFGVVPTYWSCKAFWVGSSGGTYWPYLAIGIAHQSLLIFWLAKRFERTMAR